MSNLALVTAMGALLLSSSPVQSHGKGLYSTKSEAQQRAQELGCSMVHQNNGRWMPCANECELHQHLRQQ